MGKCREDNYLHDRMSLRVKIPGAEMVNLQGFSLCDLGHHIPSEQEMKHFITIPWNDFNIKFLNPEIKVFTPMDYN